MQADCSYQVYDPGLAGAGEARGVFAEEAASIRIIIPGVHVIQPGPGVVDRSRIAEERPGPGRRGRADDFAEGIVSDVAQVGAILRQVP